MSKIILDILISNQYIQKEGTYNVENVRNEKLQSQGRTMHTRKSNDCDCRNCDYCCRGKANESILNREGQVTDISASFFIITRLLSPRA